MTYFPVGNKPLQCNTQSHTCEIPAPDLNKATNYLPKIFRWETEIITPANMRSSPHLDNSGGGFDTSLKPAAEGTGPQLTIDVEDIDGRLRQNSGRRRNDHLTKN